MQEVNIKNCLRLLLIIICGIVVGLNIYNMNSAKLLGNKLPMPFGIGTAVVVSESMYPEYSIGDLVVVKEENEYFQNEIVVFQNMNDLIVHRIIQINDDTVITKGDANNVADKPISKESIRGKVIAKIPFIGMFVNFLKTPVGCALIVLYAILLIEIPRRREIKKNDEKRQEMLDEIKRLQEQLKK